MKLATSGAGWPPPTDAGTWAPGPDDLAGKGGELAEVLARVPTGRLVVLGEPGAGKTMLMVRLVLDLLARRAEGGPVPFLASVASWNPANPRQDLRGWLVAQLLIDHPALGDPPFADRTEPTQAEALLASGKILPILDGLDEIPEEFRGSAISRINDALRPSERLVVTCRSEEYRGAVRPKKGFEVTLRAAAAVQLRPLDADAVRGYLLDDAAGPVTKARWDPVLAVLGTEAPAGQALSTPLMVGLARAIFNPRPGELAGTLPDPADELCSPDLTDRKAVESVLFDAFIPAAYRHDTDRRWQAQDAERWLVFLARHLQCTIVSPDLAWWQLLSALWADRVFALTVGLALAAVLALALAGGVAVAGIVFGTWAGAALGTRAGVAVGVLIVVLLIVNFAKTVRTARRESPRPVREISGRLPVRGIRARPPSRRNIVWGVGVGLFVGFSTGPGHWPGNLPWVVLAVPAGVVAGAVNWVINQKGAPLDLSSAASPLAVLAGDRRTGTAFGVVFGIGTGIVAGIVAGPGVGAGATLGTWAAVAVGVAAGVAVGVGAIFGRTAWPFYEVARIWLVLRRRLPWQLMGFLADAHRRGVLRQAGAVYQFRHIELQHRLASRDADKRQASSSTA